MTTLGTLGSSPTGTEPTRKKARFYGLKRRVLGGRPGAPGAPRRRLYRAARPRALPPGRPSPGAACGSAEVVVTITKFADALLANGTELYVRKVAARGSRLALWPKTACGD